MRRIERCGRTRLPCAPRRAHGRRPKTLLLGLGLLLGLLSLAWWEVGSRAPQHAALAQKAAVR